MSLRPKPYHQTLKDLTDASTKINDYAVSTDEILTFDENTDVLLPSGKFAKSLDKRLKEQFAQAVVLSVNNKTGHIELGNVVDYDVSDLPISEAQKEYITNSRKNIIYVDDEIKENDSNDHSIAFRRAITKAGIGGTVLFTGGKTYNMHTPSIILSGQRITSSGGRATLKNMFNVDSYPRGTNLAIIQAGYTLTGAYSNLKTSGTSTAIINIGSNLLSVSNVSLFKSGNLINIGNYSAKVVLINGSVLTLDRVAPYDVPSGTTIYIADELKNIEVSNFHFDFNGTTANPRYGFGINIHAASDCHIYNITAEFVGSKVAQYARTVNSTLRNITCFYGTDNRGNGGHGYVARFSGGCDGCIAENVNGTGTRHTVDIAGASRNIIKNCTGYYNDSTAFLTHGLESHYNQFIDCNSYSSVDGAFHFPIGDKYNIVNGGFVYGRLFVGSANFDETNTFTNMTVENCSATSNTGKMLFTNSKFIFTIGLPSSMLRYSSNENVEYRFNNCQFVFNDNFPANCLVSATGTGKINMTFNNCVLDFKSINIISTINKESSITFDNCSLYAPQTTSSAPLISSSGLINCKNSRFKFDTSGLYFFGLTDSTTVLHLDNSEFVNATNIWRRYGTLPTVILDNPKLNNSTFATTFANTTMKTNVGYRTLPYPLPTGVYTKGDIIYLTDYTVGGYIGRVYDGTAWKGFGKIE